MMDELDKLAREHVKQQTVEFPITAIRYAIDVRNAFRTGYTAARPQVTTEVPTEAGAYWVKESSRLNWWLAEIDEIHPTRGYWLNGRGWLIFTRPGTLFCRALPPEE